MNVQETQEATNSGSPENPRWLHSPLQMMHGREKSLSHTFLIPRARFQKGKGEVSSVFKRWGYLPSGDYFRCVFHVGKGVFPLPWGTKSKSYISIRQVFLLPRFWQLHAPGSGSYSEAPRPLHATLREPRQLFHRCRPLETWEIPREVLWG